MSFRTNFALDLTRDILELPNRAIDAIGLTRCWLIFARRAIDACYTVVLRTGLQVFALGTLVTRRFVNFVLSFGAKDTIILFGFVPHLEFATNFISFGVANLRFKLYACIVDAVVPVLQSGTRPHVCTAFFPQHDCASVIWPAGTVSETLELFELVDAWFPLSLVVAVHAGDAYILGRYSETNGQLYVTDGSVCVVCAKGSRKGCWGDHTSVAQALK